MAEKSISSMMEVESLADTDMLVVSVGGETKKVSVKTLKDSVGGGGGFAPIAGAVSYEGIERQINITPITGNIIQQKEYFLQNGLVGASGGSYVTCNLDKTLVNGSYIVILNDNGTEYQDTFTWNGSDIDINILGTLHVTSTTAGLTYYSGSYRDIYCDIYRIID